MPIELGPGQLIITPPNGTPTVIDNVIPMPEDLYPEVAEIINDTIWRADEGPLVEGTTITNSLDVDSDDWLDWLGNTTRGLDVWFLSQPEEGKTMAGTFISTEEEKEKEEPMKDMYDVIEEIKEQFAHVLEYSQNIPDVKVDKLFDTWREAKMDFYRAFGNKLIYEVPEPITFELDTKKKNRYFSDFLYRLSNKNLDELKEFVRIQEKGFWKNEVVEDYYKDGKIKIAAGMKLIKAFKFFVEDKYLLSNIQDDASRLIQENCITGTLCFSIHPLDFLSASENCHNWRSCHALDGEYRGGNLSYMTDKCTYMAYLKSNESEAYALPNFPHDVKWNSKKWRCYMFISDDGKMLMASRQYPFMAGNGLDIISKYNPVQPRDCFSWNDNVVWSPWSNYSVSEIKDEETGNIIGLDKIYIPVNHRLYSKKKLIKNIEGSLQYNDLLFSSCYEPYYSYATVNYNVNKRGEWQTGFTTSDTKFSIGGPVPCLVCEEDKICNTEILCCSKHLDEYSPDPEYDWYCDCCGDGFWDNDDSYYVDGEYWCYECTHNHAEQCEECGDWHRPENMYRHTDRAGEEHWYCESCYNDIREGDNE